jgi:two-component system response regulator NreC
MTNKLKILIAEDHRTVREGLKLIIDSQEDMQTIGEAGDGREIIELAIKLQPDLVLMDISMPHLNGLVATAKLKRIAPDIKILILTRHTDDSYLRELMQAGASGYALKQSPSSELLRAVRVIAEGGTYIDSQMTEKIFGYFTEKPRALRGETASKALTVREKEVLRYIALGHTNKEISERMDVSVKTVEAHKANSLKKLDLKSRQDIVKYAISQGWMQEN